MTDYVHQPESFLFAPRTRHGDIKKSYRGTPPSFYDGWIFETLHDLYMEIEAPHKDYDVEGLRMTMRELGV